MNWEFGVGRRKLLYLELIDKVLMYNTGNDIQYSVINQYQEYKNVYTCKTESLCYIKKLAQHLFINYTTIASR